MLISQILNNQIAVQDLNITSQLSDNLSEILSEINANSNLISYEIFQSYLSLSSQYATAFNTLLIGSQSELYPCSVNSDNNTIIFYFYRTVIFNSKTSGNLPWYYSGNYSLQPYFALDFTSFFDISETQVQQIQMTEVSGCPTNNAIEYPSSDTPPESFTSWQNYWLSQITQFKSRVDQVNVLINTFKTSSS
jgi:hypothetical protein